VPPRGQRRDEPASHIDCDAAIVVAITGVIATLPTKR
jgi:hypothetical protein